MSPRLLAILRAIDAETRRLAATPDPMGARYPRDYYRPAELVRRWRGPGRFYWTSTDAR